MRKQNTNDDPSSLVTEAGTRSLPRGIWVLGFGSLFMDMSSEWVHSLLPILMSTTLGASMVTIGLVEGIAEAAAAITKVFSGVISDYLKKRKFLVVLGYGLGAMSKPVFPLANSMAWVFSARFVDRVGKGIRGAPRDALVADMTPPELRGAAYGLRQSLDSVGAFLGPLLAIAFMYWYANDIKAVLWVAVVPAFIAVTLLAIALREPGRTKDGLFRKPIRLADAKRLELRFWLIVTLGAVFTLARFSEAFLILRAEEAGFALAFVPIVLIVMNVVYASVAYPAGIAADRLSPRSLLIVGLAMMIVADGILAAAGSPAEVLMGAAFWGLHMALTQGLFSKLVADSAPLAFRGTAFGIFNLVTGASLLLASVIAGALWSRFGAPATFMAGAGFATLTLFGLLAFPNRRSDENGIIKTRPGRIGPTKETGFFKRRDWP